MANNTSSKKAIRQIEKRTKVNKARTSRIKTYIKKANSAILDGTQDEALNAFKIAQSEIGKGISKGVIKKNTAARKISKLSNSLKNKSNLS